MKDINFLVEENPFEGQLQKEKKSIPAVKITALVLVIAVGIAVLLAPGMYVRILEARASAIEKKLTDVKYSEVKAVKAQLSQVTNKVNSRKAIINAIDAENLPASQILLIAKNALPSGCFIKSVNYNGKSFTISGFSESSLIAMDYLSNLERLQLFESSSQKVPLNETQSVVEFSITFNLQTQGGERK